MNSPEDLAQCIIFASTQSPYAQSASSMLDRLRLQCPDEGARLCMQLLQSTILSSTYSDHYFHILFYALSTLQYWIQNPKDEIQASQMRSDLRFILFQYIHTQQNTCIIPKYVRTKMGLLVALLIQLDFPHSWPTAFDDLIQQLVTGATIQDCMKQDIFLRVLDAFCDEVVDDTSRQHNTFIKDVMRNIGAGQHHHHRTSSMNPSESEPMIVSILLQAIWDIIQCYKPYCYTHLPPKENHHPYNNRSEKVNEEMYTMMQQIPILALKIFNRFIPWVDVTLVNQPQIGMVMEEILCKAGGTRDSTMDGIPSSQLAVQALQYYNELLIRGMEEHKKLQLVMDLNVLEVLRKSGINLDQVDETHISVVIKAAEIVHLIGLEILPRWEQSSSQGINMESSTEPFLQTTMSHLLFLFYKCLAYDDIDVSSSVIPLASRIITSIEKERQVSTSSAVRRRIDLASNTTQLSKHMEPLLTIVYTQMRYPSTFRFDFEDEDEAEEEVYRSELRKLYIYICRVDPNLCLEFICKTFASLSVPLSSVHTSDLEVALRLIYHYCEGLRPPPGVQVALKSDAFTNLLLTLHRSDVAIHSHREILILYYDVSVRYCTLFNHDHTSELSSLLSALTGASGIQHGHPRVRSRSCYLLLKLVQAMGKGMTLYTEAAVMGIQGLVSRQEKLPLEDNDILYLFETVGLLLGNSDLDETTQQSFLVTIIEPHAISIEHHLSSPYLTKDPEYYGKILSNSVAAIAYLTKGFSKPTSGIQSVLTQTLPLCHRVLTSLSTVPLIRSKVLIYLQRMILCLGNKSLTYLHPFIQVLIKNADVDDVSDIGQLLNQICTKFKREAFEVVNPSILAFIKKCEIFIPKVDDVANTTDAIPPHLITEQVVIKKLMFAMISYVVSNDLTEVLLSPINASSLEDILKVMYDGALRVDVSTVKKYCIHFFRELIKQWAPAKGGLSRDHPNVHRGFLHFIYTNLVPDLLDMILRSSFNEQDANDSRVLRDIGFLIYDLLETRGLEEFQTMVVPSFTMKMHMSPAEGMSSLSQVYSAEQMSTSLSQSVSRIKGNGLNP